MRQFSSLLHAPLKDLLQRWMLLLIRLLVVLVELIDQCGTCR